MKYITLTFLFFVVAIAGYRYGYSVGFKESRILNISTNALNRIDAIKEMELNSEINFQALNEIEINGALISYGEYLKEEPAALPLLYSAKSVIHHSFSLISQDAPPFV